MSNTTIIENKSQSSISIRWGKSPDDVLKVYANDLYELRAKVEEAKEVIKLAHGLKELNNEHN
jgi:hypothetical protein